MVKQYKLNQSPFYKLKSKAKLAQVLLISKKELLFLAKTQPYKTFPKKVNGKIRIIDEPRGLLKNVHSRIKELIMSIEAPAWIFSGRKGLSYIDNAKYHQFSKYVITCDIKSFYANCTKERVFQTFKYRFHMSDDVAWIIADLVTYKNSIPTGSPSSQAIAFLAYFPTFQRINKIISNKSTKTSLFVDDLTISSSTPLNKRTVELVMGELKKVGHTLKGSKTRYYGRDHFKLITGVALSPNFNLKVPNKRRKKLLESLQLANEEVTPSIIGQIRSARLLEPEFGSVILK